MYNPNSFGNSKNDGQFSLYQTIPIFTTLSKKSLENIMEKGENAGKQHFLIFP